MVVTFLAGMLSGPLEHLLGAGVFPEAGARRKEPIRNVTSLVEP